MPDFIRNGFPWTEPIALHGIRGGLGAAWRYTSRAHPELYGTRRALDLGAQSSRCQRRKERTELKMAKRKNGTRSLANPERLASTDGNGKIQVVIETPKGSRNKYSF